MIAPVVGLGAIPHGLGINEHWALGIRLGGEEIIGMILEIRILDDGGRDESSVNRHSHSHVDVLVVLDAALDVCCVDDLVLLENLSYGL